MRSLVTGTLMLLAAGPAVAQDLAEACTALKHVEVGQWARYDISAPQMGEQGSGTMRFAIVGTEQAGGSDYYWHEMKMDGEMGSMIMQLLVPAFPYDQGDIQSAVMKMGDQPAMKMPEQMMSMWQGRGESPAVRAAKGCDSAEMVGWEEVTVPAGTFRTMHLKSTEEGAPGDVWVSLDIPYGLVKFEGSGGEAVMLLEHGRGATSSITETPQEMPMGGRRP